MKAYIIKMSFEGITPQIWRRIILPAGGTFYRLHQTIQCATNFDSLFQEYHSFSFEIEDDFITDNRVLIEEAKGKKDNKRTVKSAKHVKFDVYLEKYGVLTYTYDFGDDWKIRIVLEEIVEDYYFGHPTILDGGGTAPPEDVGGVPGYEEFLSVYHNPTHPEYLFTYAWAEQQGYVAFDIDALNDRLKYVKYKKTEWTSIKHKNYDVLSDKYRKSDIVNLEEVPNKDVILYV